MFGEGKFEFSKLSSPCLVLLAILIVSVLEIAGLVALMPKLSSLSLSMNNSSSKMATNAVLVAFWLDLIDTHDRI